MKELFEKIEKALISLQNRNTQLTGDVEALKANVRDIESLKQNVNKLSMESVNLRKGQLGVTMARTAGGGALPGRLSDVAAAELAAAWIGMSIRMGKFETIVPDARQREDLLSQTKSLTGLDTRALSTTEVPLPTSYGRELRELIAQFGVVRNNMFPYPLGPGTSKPPRMGDRPAFASIAMAAPFGELKPAFGFASLESHKVGGVVIPTRELDDQSIVPLGNFLAMYGAVEFARAEDTWGLLADGTATYESVKGVCTIATENGKNVVLGAGKTKPSDATLDNFRTMRSKVSTAALSGGKYYINQSFEVFLRSFNTLQDTCFVYLPSGMATLDGFPIVWTEVLQPYSTAAAAGKFLAAFGRMNFWWFGERGTPRMDTSAHVYFANDLLAVRFIEEIDFDYCSLEAMSVLQTAAA